VALIPGNALRALPWHLIVADRDGGKGYAKNTFQSPGRSL